VPLVKYLQEHPEDWKHLQGAVEGKPRPQATVADKPQPSALAANMAQPLKFSPLPHVDLKVEGQDITCIIDCGAAFSIMTEPQMHKLNLVGRLTKKAVKYASVHGTTHEALGVVAGVMVELAPGWIIRQDFVITPASSFSMLIGANFIRETSAEVDFGANTISFSQDQAQGGKRVIERRVHYGARRDGRVGLITPINWEEDEPNDDGLPALLDEDEAMVLGITCT